MKARKAEQLTVEFLKKNGITIYSGEKYSIRCQYAQIENVVNDSAERFATDFIYSLNDLFCEDEMDAIKARYIDYKNSAI